MGLLNQALINALSTIFLRRTDSTMRLSTWESFVMQLPGLIAYYSFSTIHKGNNTIQDMSPNGLHLTMNGTPTFSFEYLKSYAILDGSGDYFTRNDEAILDLAGNETYWGSKQGVTICSWVYWDGNDAAERVIAAKESTATTRTFRLSINTLGQAISRVSSNGSSFVGATAANVTPNSWTFVAFTYDITSLTTWVNDTSVTVTAGIPTSLFNSTSAFSVGGLANGTGLFTGKIGDVIVCNTFIDADSIKSIYNISYPIYYR